jgi:hypothetical protein
MLTAQLRELEADCLISRTVFAEVPPKVEYEITPKARGARPDDRGIDGLVGGARQKRAGASDNAGPQASRTRPRGRPPRLLRGQDSRQAHASKFHLHR